MTSKIFQANKVFGKNNQEINDNNIKISRQKISGN